MQGVADRLWVRRGRQGFPDEVPGQQLLDGSLARPNRRGQASCWVTFELVAVFFQVKFQAFASPPPG